MNKYLHVPFLCFTVYLTYTDNSPYIWSPFPVSRNCLTSSLSPILFTTPEMCRIHWKREHIPRQKSSNGFLTLLSFKLLVSSSPLFSKGNLQHLMRDCQVLSQLVLRLMTHLVHISCTHFHIQNWLKSMVDGYYIPWSHMTEKTNEDSPWYLKIQRYQVP